VNDGELLYTLCYSNIKLTALLQSLLRSLWSFIYSRTLQRFTEPKCWLLGGRRHRRQVKPGRIISLHLSKIQVDVIVLPTPDLREEQSVVNMIFANKLFFFISVNQVSCRVDTLCLPYLEGPSFKSRLKGLLFCLAFFISCIPPGVCRDSTSNQVSTASLCVVSIPLLARPAVWRCCNLGESFAKKKFTFNSQSLFGYHCLVLVALTLLNNIIVWSYNCVRP